MVVDVCVGVGEYGGEWCVVFICFVGFDWCCWFFGVWYGDVFCVIDVVGDV